MRNFHQMVIHYRCQVIERPPIGFDQDIVIQILVFQADLTPKQILYDGCTFFRRFEPDDILFPVLDPLSGFGNG